MSCLIDTKTSGEKVNYLMTRLYPGLELPQFRELITKKGEQMNPGGDSRAADLSQSETVITKQGLTGESAAGR